MMFFKRGHNTAHHQDGFSFGWLVHLNYLETASERRVLFKMLFYSSQVVAATVRKVPRASAGLSRFAASPVPAAPPAPIKV